MSAPLPTPAAPPSNGVLIRRLLGLTWRYRLGCIKVLSIQFVLGYEPMEFSGALQERVRCGGAVRVLAGTATSRTGAQAPPPLDSRGCVGVSARRPSRSTATPFRSWRSTGCSS